MNDERQAQASARAQMKQRAAQRAVELVEPGMVVGLGAGSTAAYAVAALGERVRAGRLDHLVCVACAESVAKAARARGLRVVALSDAPEVDLTIDGADEVDSELDLIKGAGGALLHEKMVAQATRREVIVVDAGKLSARLGTRCAIPVEVYAFGWRAEERFLRGLGVEPALRTRAGAPFRTDEGNLILDCRVSALDKQAWNAALAQRAGIAGHGVFLGLASDVLVGDETEVRHLRRDGGAA